MRLHLLIPILLLSACATSAKPDPMRETAPREDGSLPAQTLARGECGLFGWTKTDPPMFKFFVKGSTGRFGEMTLLAMSDEFPAARYQVTGRDDVLHLDLGAGSELDGGQRYLDAKVTVPDSQGWETIQPMVAVLSCQR